MVCSTSDACLREASPSRSKLPCICGPKPCRGSATWSMGLEGQLRNAAKVQFSLCSPTSNAFGNLRTELLVQAESPLRQFVRVKRVGQLHHGLTDSWQGVTKLALQVSFNPVRFNGLGFGHRTHALARVHCWQSSPQKVHPKLLAPLAFT